MGIKRRIALREGAREFPKTRFFFSFFPGLKGATGKRAKIARINITTRPLKTLDAINYA
jgi:hypothetical protein